MKIVNRKLKTRKRSTYVLAFALLLVIFLPAAYIITRSPNPASAAWFDDSFAYRNAIAISSHTAAENNVYVSTTLDTSASGQFQSDCGDLRFTDVGGKILKYFISSGCGTGTTVIHVFFDSFPAGAQTIYYYYGNQGATNGYASADFATEAASYVVGAIAAQEKSEAPIAYWSFDDGTGITAQDSTANNNDGTITNATWVAEDRCISGKCLYFDGDGDYVSIGDKHDMGTSDMSISLWFRTADTDYSLISKSFYASTDSRYAIVNESAAGLKGFFDSGPNYDTSPLLTNLSDNKWHQAQLVYDRDGSMTLYVDGVVKASIVISLENADNLQTNSLLLIGSYNDVAGTGVHSTAMEFQGFIDDVRIYGYARTAAQIKADYNSKGAATAKGNSAKLGSSKDNNDALSQGLVGYWKMDEGAGAGSTLADSSGNVNTGTAKLWGGGNTATDSAHVAGKFGNAFSFDGGDDYVSIADSVSLSPTTVTVSLWLKADAYNTGGNYPRFVMKNGSYDLHMYGAGGSEGRIEWDLRTPEEDSPVTVIGDALQLARWYHLVGTYDGTTAKIFIDGVEKASKVLTGNITDTSSILSIGSAVGTSNFFDGTIDEVRIYNRALSPKEVRDLYNWAPGPVGYWNFEEGTGISVADTSGNGYAGTFNGTAPAWTTGKFGKAGTFNGSDNYVSASQVFSGAQGGLTLSAWAKPSSVSGGTIDGLIGNAGSYFVLEAISGSWRGRIYDGSSNVTGTGGAQTANQWDYMTMSWDGSTMRVYKNSILQSSTVVTTPQVWTGAISIGTLSADTTYTFPGQIDEVKIYNYARTQKQIVSDMNAGHPAGGSPVGSQVAYWKLDEGYLTTANDSTPNANNLTLSTSSWTNSGKFGKAWNGTGALWLSRADDADFDVTATDDYAVSLWYKSDSATNPSTVEYLFNKASATIAGYAIYANTSGQICFGIDDDTTWNPDVASCTSDDFYDASWHHAVALRDTTADKIYIYIDGIQRDSDTDSTTATLANSLSLYVGDLDGTDNGDEFNGDLDELKIYRYALTSDEIKVEYNQGSAIVLGALGDNSTYQKQAANQEYCVPGDTTSCAAPNARFDLEEISTPINDISGNGYTGTVTGATLRQPGKVGKAASFDGTDNISTTYTHTYTTGITFETWIKTSLAATGYFYGDLVSAAGTQANIDAGGTVTWLGYNSGVKFAPTSTGTVNNNAWHHVAFVWDGTTATNGVKIYIDGKLDTQTTATGTYGAASCAINIGDTRTGACVTRANSEQFNGSLDQVRIYDYARTPAQVAYDYNRGGPVGWWKFDECQGTTAYDASVTNSNNGTITIGASGEDTVGTCTTSSTAWGTGATGKFNSSLSFDGTDDRVDFNDIGDIGSGEFSASFWINTTDSGSNRQVFNKGNTGDWEWFFNLSDSAANKMEWILSQASGALYTGYLVSTTTINDGVWHHVVGTWNPSGTTTKLYIDGKLEGTVTSTSGSFNSNSAGDMSVGGRQDGYQPLAGLIDDVRVYNYALTATQIKLLYNENAATRFAPLTGTP